MGTIDCPFTNGGPFGPNYAQWMNANYCCFAAGTKISTVSGEVPVEKLQEGDFVLSRDGKAARVKWIGRRRVILAFAPTVQPIRISRGTIAENTPHRDLIVSPEHGIYLNGVLIPAKVLVNGTTIAEVAMTEVTYYHVECDRHAVIFAEGLAVESFLDTGLNAGFFSNAPVATQLHVNGPGSVSAAASRGAYWRNWFAARATGMGTRIYNLSSALGAQAIGQGLLNLGLHVVQNIQGACAPRAYFGKAVDKARQMIKAREAELVDVSSGIQLKRIA